jgi:segregation and condensation protein A
VPVVATEHIHAPRTSVREQAGIIAGRLKTLGRATFRQLTSDCVGTYEVVARFLALLDLYRDGNVSFEQVVPLGDLYVTWAGRETGPPIRAGEEDDWT